MKYNILIVAISVWLFSCNGNGTNSKKGISNDSILNVVGRPDTTKQIIKASAGLPSDSLEPGKTTAESWRVSGFTNPEKFKSFFIQYKKWVADNNIDSIVAHIKFPLRTCASPGVFKKNYSGLFNSRVKQAVAKQDPEKFFANYNGAMVGNGELWFNEIKNNYYVIAVNN